jgi:hypothetical protein
MPANVKRFTSPLALALLFALLPTGPVHAEEPLQRTYGADRIATAVAASQEHRASAAYALLATAASYPDALPAGPAACAIRAHLLLHIRPGPLVRILAGPGPNICTHDAPGV